MAFDKNSSGAATMTRAKNSPVPPRRFKKRYIVLLLLLVLLAVTGFMAFTGVKQHLTDGAAHFQNAAGLLKDNPDLLTPAGLDKAQAELLAAQFDFKQARNSLGLYAVVLPVAWIVPGVGYDAAHLDDFLNMSDQAAQAGLLALEGLRPLAATFEQKIEGSGIGGDKLIKLSKVLQQASVQQNFKQADDLINQVQQERKHIEASKLGLDQTKKAVALLDKDLPTLQAALDAAVSLPPLLPALLAQNGPRNYVVLAQNDDELRATGGFISAVGLMTVDGGRITMSNFRDSYAVDNFNYPHPTPPPALTQYMLAGQLVLRDANWWPDFPTSARQIMAIYQQDQQTKVDGVLAINLRAVQALFGAFGSITLPDFGETLTQDNFLERLHYYYQPPGTSTDGDWWLHRKDFIGAVFKGIVGRLNGAGAHDYLKLAGVLGDQLSQHQVQTYFADSKLESEILERHNLDGALANSAGDFLMVADSNVGFNKINPKIDQKISYKLTSDANNQLQAELTITYHNNGGVREGTQAGVCEKKAKYDSSYDSMINGCYWDYVRIYAPEGSQLVSASGFPPDSKLEMLQENHKTAWGNQLVMLPGADATLKFVYTLPGTVWTAGSPYQLTVQKEAGSQNIPLTVQINSATGKFGSVQVGPSPQQQTNTALTWEIPLKTDFKVTVAVK